MTLSPSSGPSPDQPSPAGRVACPPWSVGAIPSLGAVSAPDAVASLGVVPVPDDREGPGSRPTGDGRHRLDAGDRLDHPLLPLPAPETDRPTVGPPVTPPPVRTSDQPVSASDTESSPRLPDPTAWSTWIARMLIEVTDGRRPVGQLSRWAEDRVLATVVLRTRQLKLGSGIARPGVAAERRSGAGHSAVLGTLRVQRPTPVVVEAMATVRADRPAAFAFRLEARGERWLCTVVDFGPQTPQPA